MPIPHLTHKIHSPNNWKNERPSKIWRRKKSFSQRSLLSFRKGKKKLIDLRFKKGRDKINLLRLLRRWWPHLIVLFLLVIIGLIGLLAWFSKDLPDPQQLTVRSVAQSTKIYDRTGEHLLYEIHGEQKRTLIPLKEIPQYAIQATLALEDQRFFEHKGFNLWGMFRGVILRALKGQRLQGGSTLTQQLIKNAILTGERTMVRKIKELILAYRIEKKYSKEDILQMYFNEIPYGSTAYGIEAAAFTYFGKSARDLSLAEAALLAALPKAPTYLSPYGSHTDELFLRQHYALDQMVKLGHLTKEEAKAAKEEELIFKTKIEGIEAPHFVFFVKERLSEKYSDTLIERGGWKIISTLDYDLQKKAEAIIVEQAEKNLQHYGASNAALVAIDVETGQIIAMVGSKDFFNEEIDGQVNVALANRQPGSSFKPIVYTASWLKGFIPETVVYDLETVFPVFDGDYIPHNYDLKERGPITLRKALAGSVNIPAVKMIYLAGIENVLALADELEYTTFKDRSRFGLSLVLGGGEVKLLEHTNAYAALAREGKKTPYSAILKLEDNEGKVLEEFKEPRSQKVIEPEIARLTTDVLSDNNARAFIFGENNYLTLGDRPVAAKTGTTNNYRDAWTLGYTPQLAVGVWVGNNDNSEMKKGADGSMVASPIWRNFMGEALKDKPVIEFTKPNYKIPDKPMLGGDASGVKVKIDKISGLLATEATPAHLVEEKVFKQAHSILHYVNKDDPLGPVPKHPEQDEYYQNWEEAVAEWAQENGITNEAPPTEYDNLHQLSDRPAITFRSPLNNETITEQTIVLEVEAKSPRGVRKVEYYLDEILIATSYQNPFNQNAVVSQRILNGQRSLTARAYDDLENVNEDIITINLEREAYLNINWLEPPRGTTLTLTDFPQTLMINVDNLARVKKVDFYSKPADGQNSRWLGYVSSPEENNIKINWAEAPQTGVYKLYPIITDWQNQVIEGPEITISIE